MTVAVEAGCGHEAAGSIALKADMTALRQYMQNTLFCLRDIHWEIRERNHSKPRGVKATQRFVGLGNET
jgi:hypothetical protein